MKAGELLARLEEEVGLSVSSAGSKGVKADPGTPSLHKTATFSILGRIEGGESRAAGSRAARRKPLSVSSAGSKGVKVYHAARKPGMYWSFSILGRIEGGERGKVKGSRPVQTSFSILGRIEGGESLGAVNVVHLESPFQYPRPDRRG